MVFNKLRSIIRRGNKREVIIVSGLPRSGTSMMMAMLQAGGVPLLTDDIRQADEDNPRGYFEFEKVKKLVDGEKTWLPEAVGKAVKVIAPLISHLPDDYRYKVIYMQRNMEEILASQRAMLDRRIQDSQGVRDDKIRDIYNRNQNAVMQFMDEKAYLDYIVCDYNEILRDPVVSIKNVIQYLNLAADVHQMMMVVDPGLYRKRVSE